MHVGYSGSYLSCSIILVIEINFEARNDKNGHSRLSIYFLRD